MFCPYLKFYLHKLLNCLFFAIVSTTFVGYYPIWRGQPSASVPFSIKVQIEYPEEIIMYLTYMLIFFHSVVRDSEFIK